MYALANQQVLIAGLGVSGRAASRLCRQRGAQVTAIDERRTDELAVEAARLRELGVRVVLGASAVPEEAFDLAVISPGVPTEGPWVRALKQRQVRVIGELELGYQQSRCLNVAVSGTNGKTTTTELIERLLLHAQRKTVAAGNIGRPFCALADQSQDLDLVVLEVSSFQLETIQFFRPVVAVLLNITPDHLDRYASMADYAKAKARLFMNQQPFDWAVIQSEALAYIRSLDLPVPSKVITFSASNRRADLFLDRGLLTSRLPEWTGPLLDLEECKIGGPHNAENLMAALAVGHVLRLPLEQMKEALTSYAPAPHRCELILEVNGVRFVNDSKATNLDAVQKAILSMPAPKGIESNILLIAGGRDKGLAFHDIGPLLAQRVKHAFLLGETREKLRAAWSLFTPCTAVASLLEAVTNAFEHAVPGDVVLLSPACASFDMFQDYQHRGMVFRQAVEALVKATSSQTRHGSSDAPPKPVNNGQTTSDGKPQAASPQGLLRETPMVIKSPTT